jgi:hypothetical protein
MLSYSHSGQVTPPPALSTVLISTGSPVIDVPSLISPGVSELERFPLDLNRGGFRRRVQPPTTLRHLDLDWTAQVWGVTNGWAADAVSAFAGCGHGAAWACAEMGQLRPSALFRSRGKLV